MPIGGALHFVLIDFRYSLPEYALTVHSTIITKELNTLVNKFLKGEKKHIF